MKTFTKLSAIASILSVVSAQSGPVIDTPSSLVQCQPVALTFHDGTAPYFISVLPGGQPSAEALIRFPEQASAGTFTWTVNLPAGTSVSLAITDSTGAQNFAQQVTIQQGNSDSCLTATTGASVTASVSGGSGTSASDTAAQNTASTKSQASNTATHSTASTKATVSTGSTSSTGSRTNTAATTTGTTASQNDNSAASTVSMSFAVVAAAAFLRLVA